MRLLALFAVFVSTTATAKAIDCNVVTDTMQPVQVRYHDPSGRTVTEQIFRDKSGNMVVWVKTGNGVAVTKSTLAQGILQSAEMTTTHSGKIRSSTNKITVDGLPPNFDHRTNVQYSQSYHLTWADGSNSDASDKITYTFKSEGKETVGSCLLTAIHGEIDGVHGASSRQVVREYQVYYPELMLPVASRSGEPTIDEITTDFTPMTPIQ
jgi:hypothetical protein